jgi:hypothetical protein
MGQAMTYRLWYAQLDVFDTIRRYLAILSHWNAEMPSRDASSYPISILVNPSLLHLTHMTLEVRRAFTSLGIEKPDQTFLVIRRHWRRRVRSHCAVGAAVHFGLHRLILGAIITLSKETEEPFLRKALKTAREMRAAKKAELVAAT